jgi:hypothetical protein
MNSACSMPRVLDYHIRDFRGKIDSTNSILCGNRAGRCGASHTSSSRAAQCYSSRPWKNYRHGLRSGNDESQGIIQGTLFDLSQNPVASTPVFLVPSGERRANMQLYRTTQSDANGKFTMNGIVPGQYELFAWQDIVQGAYQNEDYMRRYEGRGTSVLVMRSSTATAEVRRIPSEKP